MADFHDIEAIERILAHIVGRRAHRRAVELATPTTTTEQTLEVRLRDLVPHILVVRRRRWREDGRR